MHVLLAEGRPDVRSALQLFLEQDFISVNVVVATKTKDMLTRMSISCPDLLLLDWELPDVKAGQIMAQLRGLCPEMQIIATSGRSETREQALQAGANAFINKSDTPEQMIATINDIIK